MKTLNPFEALVIGGGHDEGNGQNPEKVKVAIPDEVDDDADQWDKFSRKFHDKVQYYRR